MEFRINQSKTDPEQFFINLVGGNGEIIMSGELQHNRSDAAETINNIKEQAADAVVVLVHQPSGYHDLVWTPDEDVDVPEFVDPCNGTCDADGRPHFHTANQT